MSPEAERTAESSEQSRSSQEDESSEPKGLTSHWQDALLSMIPAAAVGAWTAIWPAVLEIAPRSQDAYLSVFGLGVLITYLYAFHEIHKDGNGSSIRWFERFYQYAMAVVAFSIWAYYLASLTPEIPVTLITFDPAWASIAMVAFVAIAAPLLTFTAAMMGLGRKIREMGERRRRRRETTV